MKNYPLYDVPPVTRLADILALAEKEAPDREAFVFRKKKETVRKTYREFVRDVKALGAALREKEVSGEHIACVAENRYEWINTYLTVLCSPSVFLPVDKELPEEDFLRVLTEGEANIVFYSARFEKRLRENREKLAFVRFFVGFDREEDDGEFLSFSKLQERGGELCDFGYDRYAREMTAGDPEELKMLVFTSGTTGMAKGVMLSEKNLVSVTVCGLQVSTVYEKCLSVLPYHHTYEAVAGILVSLHHHSTICINDSMAAIQKNLREFQPDYLYLVPGFLELFRKKILANMEKEGKTAAFEKAVRLSRFLRKFGIDLRARLFGEVQAVFGGKMRKIVCGGAPLREEVARFYDDVGLRVCNGYGITECSPLVAANRDGFCDNRTVGVRLPCVEWKIDSPDEDGNGEILVKGPTVMLGYYRNPAETEKVFRDGYFCTGDLGHINEKEQLVITGRKKNLIVLDNGKNIYPEEIENLLAGISAIREVVVRGVKDENGKTVLLAEIFPDRDAEKKRGAPFTEEELLPLIREALSELPSYKAVKKVLLREVEFEKTTTNKIRRNA